MRCKDCKFWGNGDGTGIPYDAGHMNDCTNTHLSGQHHPSYGACGDIETKVYAQVSMNADNRYHGAAAQSLMTRWNFGCVLFEQRTIKTK